MARIRTIKPEFPQSESMGRVSREARLCFILLWTQADDAGRLRGNSRMLASILYPYDDDAKKLIDRWLKELSDEGCITQYEADGSTYIQVNGWASHQKIDKPSASKIPSPPDDSRILANVREASAADQGEDQGRDQGVEGKGPEKRRAERVGPDEVPCSVLVDAGFTEQQAADFIAHKRKRKAPLTSRAWADHQRESVKAGWSVTDAAEKVMAKNWKGFEAAYVESERPAVRGAPVVESFRERELRLATDRVRQATGGLANAHQPTFEVIDVAARKLG